MANGSEYDKYIFIKYNEELSRYELLKWIVKLLPQSDFDDYVEDIKAENLGIEE